MRRLDGKYLLVGTGVRILFDIILQLFYNLVRHNELLPYDSPGACLSDLLYNMVPCLLILLSNYLVIFTLWSRFRRKPALWLKMTVDAVLSFLLLFIINRLFLVVARIFQPETTVDVPGTILYNIVIFMCVEVAYHVAAAYELRHRQDVARQELLAYKYNLLNAQVNPHFLFNSLNNLLYLIRSNPDGACEFTRNLSRLFRHVLEVRDKSTVPLSEELDFMWHYVSILSIRYNNALNVDFQGREHVGGHRILPLVLQMLIEDIAKHNEISLRKPMTVSVRVEAERIVVSNPIHPRSNVASSSFGLGYIRECYRLQGGTMTYGGDGACFRVELSYLDR